MPDNDYTAEEMSTALAEMQSITAKKEEERVQGTEPVAEPEVKQETPPAPDAEPESEPAQPDAEADAPAQSSSSPKRWQINFGLGIRAAQVGMTPQEAERFQTQEALETAISLLEARRPQNKEEAKPDPEAEPEINLDPEIYGEDLVKFVKQQQQQISDLRKQVAQGSSQRVSAADNPIVLQTDQLFAGLGPEWHDVVGAGSVAKGTVSDIEGANRVKILKALESVASLHAQWGTPNVTEEMLRERALANAFPDKVKALQEKAQAIQDRKKLASIPPSRRGADYGGKEDLSDPEIADMMRQIREKKEAARARGAA